MAKVTVTQQVNAPLSKLWESWDEFGSIDRFNPSLTRSFLLDDRLETGLGAKRQCDFNDGKNYVQEEIIDYAPHRKLVIDIYKGSLPLKRAVATFDFKNLGPERSQVTMTMDFTLKYGVLGWMMIPPLKAQFRKRLGELLVANKQFIEQGINLKLAA